MAFPDSPQIAKPAPAETGEDVEASPSAVATHTDDPPLALSLAEALAGIKMPCELAPLVATEHTDLRNMLFAATDQPAEMVGTSVADELERLGYNLVPIDDQTIQARRGGTVVEITVYPDKTTATLALGGRATAAPDDVVIVEFQLR